MGCALRVKRAQQKTKGVGRRGRWEAFIANILRYTLKSNFRNLQSVF